jgi:hypothetical protein
MRSGSVTSKPRRGKGSFSTVEAVRALIASAALASILLLAVYVTTGSYFSADRQAKNAASKIAPLSAASGGEAAHRAASIVIETDKKGRCEERRFDNRSGKIVSATVVDCEARLANEPDATPSENMSDAERMRAILGAFRR